MRSEGSMTIPLVAADVRRLSLLHHDTGARASSRRLLQYEITMRDEDWDEQSFPAARSVQVSDAIRQ